MGEVGHARVRLICGAANGSIIRTVRRWGFEIPCGIVTTIHRAVWTMNGFARQSVERSMWQASEGASNLKSAAGMSESRIN